MSAENHIPTTGDRQRWLIALVLAITLAIGALIATQLMAGKTELGAGAEEQIAPTSPGDSRRQVPIVGNGSRTAPEAEAEKSLRGFLSGSDRSLQRSDGTAQDVNPYATQAMVDEVRNESLNLQSQGIKQTGNVTVVGVSALDSTDSEVVLGACLSTEKIRTLDRSGSDLRVAQGQNKRSMHHYTVTLVDGTWKVSAHSFPDNADC